MVIGFSGSSANAGDYISCYYTGMVNGGALPGTPIRYFLGKDWFSNGPNGPNIRWGDYSNTSLDPDGLKFWTIQEYAETRYAGTSQRNAWATRFVAVTPF
jgi:hypothetical protein